MSEMLQTVFTERAHEISWEILISRVGSRSFAAAIAELKTIREELSADDLRRIWAEEADRFWTLTER